MTRLPGLSGWFPAMPRPRANDVARSAIGAAGAVLLAVGLGHASGIAPGLLAPLGASAVLVFMTPNSPLAQPWSVLVGSAMAVLAGELAGLAAPMPWAAGLAVALAVLLMSAARALHPPGGAVALIGGLEAGHASAFDLAVPLGFVLAVVVLAGMVWARLTGRAYPFRAMTAGAPVARAGLSESELTELLVRFRQGANVGTADLARMVAAATDEAARHRFRGTRCADVMSAPPIFARPEDSLAQIVGRFRSNTIKSLPVADAAMRPLGVIQPGDVIAALTSADDARRGASAAQMMRPEIERVPADQPVGLLLRALSVSAHQIIAVMEGPRMVGVITRSDVIALLLADAGWGPDDAAPEPPGPRG